MWGAIVGIAAASVALALLQQTLEGTGLSEKKAGKPKELEQPGPDFKSRPDGKWTAPLWEEASAKEALARAKRVLRRTPK